MVERHTSIGLESSWTKCCFAHWVVAPFVACGLVLGLCGCGSDSSARRLSPLKESYRLVDRGENERAILLLERELATQGERAEDDVDVSNTGPQWNELKVLLASAYLGVSGVDVYKLHEKFKDLIFSRTLFQTFVEPMANGAGGGLPDLSGPGETPESRRRHISQLIREADYAFTQVEKGLALLNRFPEIDSKNWPLIDRALSLLDSITEPPKDIALYRAFIRIVYVKSYLDHELIRGGLASGLRSFLCEVDLFKLVNSAEWVADDVSKASLDMSRVFPDRAKFLIDLASLTSRIHLSIKKAATSGVTGVTTGVVILQAELRSWLECRT